MESNFTPGGQGKAQREFSEVGDQPQGLGGVGDRVQSAAESLRMPPSTANTIPSRSRGARLVIPPETAQAAGGVAMPAAESSFPDIPDGASGNVNGPSNSQKRADYNINSNEPPKPVPSAGGGGGGKPPVGSGLPVGASEGEPENHGSDPAGEHGFPANYQGIPESYTNKDRLPADNSPDINSDQDPGRREVTPYIRPDQVGSTFNEGSYVTDGPDGRLTVESSVELADDGTMNISLVGATLTARTTEGQLDGEHVKFLDIVGVDVPPALIGVGTEPALVRIAAARAMADDYTHAGCSTTDMRELHIMADAAGADNLAYVMPQTGKPIETYADAEKILQDNDPAYRQLHGRAPLPAARVVTIMFGLRNPEVQRHMRIQPPTDPA